MKRRTAKVVAIIVDGQTYHEAMIQAQKFAEEQVGTRVGMTTEVFSKGGELVYKATVSCHGATETQPCFRVGQKVRVIRDGGKHADFYGRVVDPKAEEWGNPEPPRDAMHWVPVSLPIAALAERIRTGQERKGWWIRRERLEAIPQDEHPIIGQAEGVQSGTYEKTFHHNGGEKAVKTANVKEKPGGDRPSVTVIDDPLEPPDVCEYRTPTTTGIYGYRPARPAGFYDPNHPEHDGIVREWKRDLRAWRDTLVADYRRSLGAKPWPHCTAAGAVADGRPVQAIVGRVDRTYRGIQIRPNGGMPPQVILLCPPCARKQKAMVRKIREVAKEIEPLRQT